MTLIIELAARDLKTIIITQLKKIEESISIISIRRNKNDAV